MKGRPIPFSAPMVRALLAGTKTQTRRVVKPQPDRTHSGHPYWNIGGYRVSPTAANPLPCPYGAPGDRLWVREAWRTCEGFDVYPPRDIQRTTPVRYEADGHWSHSMSGSGGKLRPGMFMPRWASRILLDVIEVRVERLQSISRGDAMAEGCPFPNMAKGPDPREWYAELWDQINGPGAWAANPWVWAVSFNPISSPAGDGP